MKRRLRATLIAAVSAAGCADVLGADFDDLQRVEPSGSTAAAASVGGGGAAGGGGGGGGAGGHAGGPPGDSPPIVCGNVDGLQAGAPWPMQGYCPTRQARSGATSFAAPHVRWIAELDAPIFTEPVVASDGTVYVTTTDPLDPLGGARLHAIREGVEQWFVDVTSPSSPAIRSDGTLYVFDGSRVVALAPDGSEVWQRAIAGVIQGSPAIAGDGTVYVPSSAGLFALAPSGSIAWSLPLSEQLRTPAAIGLDGTIYVASVTGTLYAVTPEGALAWSFPSSETTETMPIVGGADVIYFTTYKRVRALDASGREQWSFATGKYPTVPPSVFGKVVMATSIDDMNQFTLWALNDRGVPTWSAEAIGTAGRAALSKDGALVSFVSQRPGVFDPEVVVRLPQSGQIWWSVKADFSSVFAWPGAAWGDSGIIYVPVVDALYAIEAEGS